VSGAKAKVPRAVREGAENDKSHFMAIHARDCVMDIYGRKDGLEYLRMAFSRMAENGDLDASTCVDLARVFTDVAGELPGRWRP
jgi:hypothetical protein